MTTNPDTDALLIHGPFLRRLARSLIVDEAAADDVVQQTWLRALQRAPRDAVNLRAWLTVVMRNLAFERGRREGRQRGWEQQAALAEATPSTADIVEREALRRQVVEALLTLDEPYREVLLLRFYEELPPRAIAARLKLPVETVRTRIKRGLSRLSAALDTRHGGDRRKWALALVPFALTRSAAAGVGLGLGSITAGLGPLGQLAAAVFVAVVLAGGSTWWLLRGADDGQLSISSADGGGDQSSMASVEPTPPTPEATHLMAGGGEAPVIDVQPVAPTSTEPLLATLPPLIEGRLLDGNGAPQPHSTLHAIGIALQDVSLLTNATREQLTEAMIERTVVTDGNGRYRLGELSRGLWVVNAQAEADRPFVAPGLVLVDVPAPLAALVSATITQRCAAAGSTPPAIMSLAAEGQLSVDLTAPQVATTPARLVDAQGRPVADANVTVLSPAAHLVLDAVPYQDWGWQRLASALHTVSSRDEGLVDLALVPGCTVMVRASGFVAHTVELPHDAALPDVLKITLTAAATTTVSGTVRDPDGRPIADALVLLCDFSLFAVDHETLANLVDRRHFVHARTDERGGFLFEGVDHVALDAWNPKPLRDGDLLHVMAGAPGFLAALTEHEVFIDGADLALDLTLTRGDRCRVTLIDRDTLAPVEDTFISVQFPQRRHTTLADEDGLADFGPHPFGEVQLAASRHGFEPAELGTHDWRGEDIELLVSFEPVSWRLSVDVTDGSGAIVTGNLDARIGADVDTFVVVQAFPTDPRAMLEAFPTQWRHADFGALSGRWENGRAHFSFDDDWTSDEAWVVVNCEYEVLAVGLAARGMEQFALTARGGFVNSRSLPVEFEVVDVDNEGVPLFSTCTLLDPEGGHAVARLRQDLFSDSVTGLVPRAGDYDLHVELPDAGRGSRHLYRRFTLDGESRDQPLLVEREPEASVSLTMTDSRGTGCRATLLAFDERGRRLWHGTTDDSGEATVTLPAPGSYRLVAAGPQGASETPLPVGTVEHLHRTIRLGQSATLRLRAADSTAPHRLVRVTDAEGRVLFRGQTGVGSGRDIHGEGMTLTAVPGLVRVTCAGPGGPLISREVRLNADGEVEVLLD